MHVVVHIEGRKAVPVRAVLLATVGNVTAHGLTLELAKLDSERTLTAYQYSQGAVHPVRADDWSIQHEEHTSIARGFKRQEPQTENPEQDEHRELAWRESMKALPAGVFLWLDDLEKWYGETRYFSPHSEWEELARVVGEDDDPEPQYQPKPPVLNLYPIAMADCEDLVLQGFESCVATLGPAPAHTAAPAKTLGTAGGVETDKAGPVVKVPVQGNSTKPQRSDSIDPVIKLAQTKCSDPRNTNEVWPQMQVLAQNEHPPFLASMPEGLKYHKGGKDAYFTRDALNKRLHPEKRKAPAKRR